MYNAVQIGHEPVPKLQKPSANPLDLRVVKLAGIRHRALRVASDLNRSGVTGVPTPRQSQFPVPTMASEQGAERAKLKPAYVKLSRELFGRHKASDIRAPVGDSAETRVD